MKAPDRIYLYGDEVHSEPTKQWCIEPREGKYRGAKILSVPYIREDIVDETIKTAEDHAYSAGKEKLREELLEWAEQKYKTFYPVGAFKMMIDKIKSL